MPVIVPLPPSGGFTLNDYLFALRRLLHDPNDRMYPYADKVAYINLGRERVARDSACLRLTQVVNLLQNVELYNTLDIPYGSVTCDVMGISVFWGNLKYQLSFINFRQLDTWLRTWNTFRQRPTCFARKGGTAIYVGPVPDQNYVSEWDTAVIPNPLVDQSSQEQLPLPFQNPVPFFGAYYAKQYEQSIGEADRMLGQYELMRGNAQATWRRRMTGIPYDR